MDKDTSQARLGKSFETEIEVTNKVYSAHGLAEIQKVPTSWIVNRRGPKIVSAFPEKKSTVDFMGAISGEKDPGGTPVPIAFEAKETTGKGGKPETNFPLYVRKEETIRPHQMEFLKRWPGQAFILIHFKNRRQCFMVPPQFIENWYMAERKGGRKSIPFDEFPVDWEVDVTDYLGLLW
jgi:recombination protein U